MKTNKLLNILIPILIAILILVAAFEGYKAVSREMAMREAETELSKNRIPTDENAINFVTGSGLTGMNDEANVFLTYEDFLKNAKRTSYHVGETSATYRLARELTSGGNNVYMLHFKMCSDAEAAKINVDFGAKHTYYVTTQWHDYYVPCIKGKINTIKIMLLTDFQKLYLSDVQVLQYDSMSVKPARIKNGAYLTEEYDMYYLSESSGIGAGVVADIAGSGEYIYTAGEDILTIFKQSENGADVVSSLTGVGNVKHIEIRDDKILGLASSENGVCLVNIEDKTKPYIESFYDTLDAASDICFSGNYMFVACRYSGVEIVNISNLKKPVYISKISNDKDGYRCAVDKNHLFVSCLSTNEVEVYDISVLDKHEFITSIPVDGRCGEAFVEDDLIYIVSGYWDGDDSNDVGDPGYATGNGMAIYNISDIKHPKWLSTAKTEGSMAINLCEDWSLSVNAGLAYFTNSFGGLYVYDVSEPKAPIAVAHMGTPLHKDSKNYVDYSKNPRAVFPYDMTEFIYSPVMGVYVADGAVYYAGAYTDVYKVDFSKAKADEKSTNEASFTIANDKKQHHDYELYLADYDVNALIEYNDGYVVATGTGLVLLDSNLDKVAEYATENPVKDVKWANENYVVTAEKVGVGVYQVHENALSRIGFIETNTHLKNVTAVGVTGDGNYAIVQSSRTTFEIVDLKNESTPSFVSEVLDNNGNPLSAGAISRPGNMPYRSIVNGTVNGAVGIGGGSSMLWFESRNGNLYLRNTYPNSFYSEGNGSAAMTNGNEILSVYKNGYVIYNPLNTPTGVSVTAERMYVPNTQLNGIAGLNDDVLVLCNMASGAIQIVNISVPARPYLMAEYHVEDSIGTALVSDEFVLVPVRHGGIIRINID